MRCDTVLPRGADAPLRLAALILLRLRNVLGRRTGHERRPQDRLTRHAEAKGDSGDRKPETFNSSDLRSVGSRHLLRGLSA